jgi:hypothetical protein
VPAAVHRWWCAGAVIEARSIATEAVLRKAVVLRNGRPANAIKPADQGALRTPPEPADIAPVARS